MHSLATLKCHCNGSVIEFLRSCIPWQHAFPSINVVINTYHCSYIMEYFTINNDQNVGECKLCEKKIGFSKASKYNLTRHLRRCHPKEPVTNAISPLQPQKSSDYADENKKLYEEVYKNLPSVKRKYDEMMGPDLDRVLGEPPKAKIFVDAIKEGKLVELNDREMSVLNFLKCCDFNLVTGQEIDSLDTWLAVSNQIACQYAHSLLELGFGTLLGLKGCSFENLKRAGLLDGHARLLMSLLSFVHVTPDELFWEDIWSFRDIQPEFSNKDK